MNSKDELRELWDSQPRPQCSNGAAMADLVQKRLRRFDRTIAARNWVECVAGVAVTVFFAWTAVRAPNATMKIGAFVIAGGAAWIVFYLLRYGNTVAPSDPDRNLVGFTQSLTQRYDQQIRLLKSVKYWYLLPIYLGMLIMSAGQSLQRASTSALGWRDLAGPAIFTAIVAAIWWLNEVFAVGRLKRERARLLLMVSEEQFWGENNEPEE